MTVRDILRACLVEHGYDGLFNGDDNCDCLLPALFLRCVGREWLDCEPGYKGECAEQYPDCCDACHTYGWHVAREKGGKA